MTREQFLFCMRSLHEFIDGKHSNEECQYNLIANYRDEIRLRDDHNYTDENGFGSKW